MAVSVDSVSGMVNVRESGGGALEMPCPFTHLLTYNPSATGYYHQQYSGE